MGGCVITPDGVETKKVELNEIFPPSKTVASYIQTRPPSPLPKDGLADQMGGKDRVETLRNWDAFTTMQCEYGLPNNPPKVRVTVTEMTTGFNAYGAYTNLRPGLLPAQQYIKIGISGTIDAQRLLFVQDRYFVVVHDLSAGAETEEGQRRALLINFGKKISDRIPRAISDIDPISLLPYANRVTASERLDKEDPLGLDVLKGGAVTALYRVENQECKVFLAKLKETATTKKAFEKIAAVMKKNGELKELAVGETGFMGVLFKQRCMVARQEMVVYGCFGTLDEKEMLEMMATIDRRIKPFVPKEYKEKEGEGGTSGKNLYE